MSVCGDTTGTVTKTAEDNFMIRTDANEANWQRGCPADKKFVTPTMYQKEFGEQFEDDVFPKITTWVSYWIIALFINECCLFIYFCRCYIWPCLKGCCQWYPSILLL
jgi:hypothetical protein